MKADFPKSFFVDRKAARAFQASFAEAVATEAKNSVSQYVSPRNTHRLRHGGQWQNPANPYASAGHMLTHSAEAVVTIPDLIDHRLDALPRAVNEVAQSMHDQFVRSFIHMMEETTAQTGNVIDGASRPVSETFLEMLESSHWTVNEAGGIEPPVLMTGSDHYARLTALFQQAAPEFREKADAIIARKEMEARREEAERKARFSRYGENKCG